MNENTNLLLPLYLDHNATTPYAEEVIESVHEAMITSWGNPSSSYALGKKANALVEGSRRKIADMIDCDNPSNILFTSGGTESNNMVIHSAIKYFNQHNKNCANAKPHVITTNIEHDSIRLPIENLVSEGCIDATFIPVLKTTGQIDPTEICRAIRPETCLITVMMANNETGIIQPIREISILLWKSNRRSQSSPGENVLFHTDAAQTIGKTPVSVKDLDVDFLTIVGHKFYGPRIGALFVKDLHADVKKLSPMFFGGGQEKGLRPGTQNTAMIAGLGEAANLVCHHLTEYQSHMERMTDYLEESLKKQFGDKVVFNNVIKDVPRLPNTTSVAFNIDSVTGVEILKMTPTVAASTMAACHSGRALSSVLINSGVPEELAVKTLRLSVGRKTSKQVINAAIKHLSFSIQKLKSNMCN